MTINNTKRPRRVAQYLPLLLVGSALIGGCSSNNDDSQALSVRDEYQSLDDCKREWGDASCVAEVTQLNNIEDSASQGAALNGTSGGTSTSVYPRIVYWGPHYAPAQREQMQAAHGITGNSKSFSGRTVSVSRGGFGSTAHGHSGGG